MHRQQIEQSQLRREHAPTSGHPAARTATSAQRAPGIDLRAFVPLSSRTVTSAGRVPGVAVSGLVEIEL